MTVIGEVDEKITVGKVTKVIITYGQAYYAAVQKRKQLKREDVAIVRIEQLAPFDYSGFKRIIEKYHKAKEFVWLQE